MSFGLKSEGIPALFMWEALEHARAHHSHTNIWANSGNRDEIDRSASGNGNISLPAQPPKLVILEDNQATIQVAEKGYSKVLRHLPRTHRISLAWVSEVVGSSDCVLLYVRSDQQAADIFTKAFSRV